MQVRKFIKPSSLVGTLVESMPPAPQSQPPHTNGVGEEKRSQDRASNAVMAHAPEARDPLASHKPAEQKPGVTFAAQDSLPKLPIPDLEATCSRYLEALEPLQNSREHRDTQRAVKEFLRGEGPELQERLKKYSSGKSSYIEQFCT